MRRLFIVFDETNLTQYQINTLNEETSIEVICINHAPVKLKCNYIFINDIDFLFKVQHMNINFDNINFILLVDNIKTDLFKAGKNILILHRFLIKYNVMEILKTKKEYPLLIQLIFTFNDRIIYLDRPLSENEKLFIDEDIKAPLYFNISGYKLNTETKKTEEKHILIFGNDHTINDFPFEKLKDTDLITAGVNRIWKKYDCDYLYFLDKDIIEEMLEINYNQNNTTLIYPEKYLKKSTSEDILNNFKDKYLYKITKDINYTINSVIWLINTIDKEIYPNNLCNFYIYGVSLKWNADDKHHFWVGDNKVLNNHDEKYYKIRFDRFFKGFMKLKDEGYKIISCSKNSKINEIFPYKSINGILKRFIK